MKNLLLSLFLLAFSFALNAQSNYRPGYIITLSNDTVYGRINHLVDFIDFRLENDIRTQYKPMDIKAFGFIDGEHYVSKEVDGTADFLGVLVKGKLTIYSRQDNEGEYFYAEKEDGKIVAIPYEERLISERGLSYKVGSKRHIYVLNELTKDAPLLREEINSMKKPTAVNLVDLAKRYHKMVSGENEDSYIIFKQPLPLFRVRGEITTGYYDVIGTNKDNVNHVMFGAKVNLWLPRENGNVYFKLGLLYSPVRDKIQLYRIPVQIEYQFLAGKINPSIAIGMNVVMPLVDGKLQEFNFYPTYAVGLATDLNKKMSLSLHYGIEADGKKIWKPHTQSLALSLAYIFY